MSETDDDEALERWIQSPAVLESGPSSPMWELDENEQLGRRIRPLAGALTEVPRDLRHADVVCRQVRRRPALLAVVLGRGSHLAGVKGIEGSEGFVDIGADMLLPCRCGVDHALDGGLLRRRLMELGTPPSSRAHQIDILEVSRLENKGSI